MSIVSEEAKERKRVHERAHYKANRDEIDAKHRVYYAKNADRIKTWKASWAASPNGKIKHLVYAAKLRAKRLCLPFDISVADIVWPAMCPVLGIRLNYGAKGTGHAAPNSPSLDRIVPAKGYVKGNVVVLSMRANTIKNNATFEEIQAVATYCRLMS